MTASDITYSIKKSSGEQVFEHLSECDNDFIPPLSRKVNIGEYARKLHEKSVTFEAWAGQTLVGLVAAYVNSANGFAFISNVSVTGGYKGKGIASVLLDNCTRYVKEQGLGEIRLEVEERNDGAIGLYVKKGFREFEKEQTAVKMRLVLA